jgi:hypothetical protein
VLANITSESSHCFRKGNRNSGRRLCIMVCPSFWEDYYMLIYTHCWELMNSVGSHGSSSLPFVMKVMVCHFVSDSHEVMTALIVVLPLIVVVEISLQLHRSLLAVPLRVETLGCTQKWAKFWYPYILGSSGILYRTIPDITEGSTWGFTMLTTTCFQFCMLNIYDPYACHLKGRARMR